MLSFKEFKTRVEENKLPLRERFFRGTIFNVGQVVEGTNHLGQSTIFEIHGRGANYVTTIKEDGSISKWFIENLRIVEDAQIPTHDANGQFSFKGYTPSKSFQANEQAVAAFRETVQKYEEGSIHDAIAITMAIKSVDIFLGLMELAVVDRQSVNISLIQAALNKAIEKLTQIGEYQHHMEYLHTMADTFVVSKSKQEQIGENVDIIKSNDKLKVASMIASAYGVDATRNNAEVMVSAAIRAARKDPAWSKTKHVLQGMLEIARSVGIKFDEKQAEMNESDATLKHIKSPSLRESDTVDESAKPFVAVSSSGKKLVSAFDVLTHAKKLAAKDHIGGGKVLTTREHIAAARKHLLGEDLEEGLGTVYHKFMSKRHGKKADDAFDLGNEKEFAKQIDKSEEHRIKSGGKPRGFNTDPDKKFLTRESEELDESVRSWKSAVESRHGGVEYTKFGNQGGVSNSKTIARDKSGTIVGVYKHHNKDGTVYSKVQEDTLDELSINTLSSYKDKAEDSAKKLVAQGAKAKKPELSYAKFKKATSRLDAVHTAKKKIFNADWKERTGQNESEELEEGIGDTIKKVAKKLIAPVNDPILDKMKELDAEVQKRKAYTKARSNGATHAAALSNMHTMFTESEEIEEQYKPGLNVTIDHNGKPRGGKIRALHGSVIEVAYKNGKVGFHHSHNVSINEDQKADGPVDPSEYADLAAMLANLGDTSTPAQAEHTKPGHSFQYKNETHRHQLVHKAKGE